MTYSLKPRMNSNQKWGGDDLSLKTGITSDYHPSKAAFWFSAVKMSVITELRRRSRRWTSLAAILGMMVLSWNMIADPSSGSSLIVVQNARVAYTSSTLALGSATLLGFVMGLLGFYLMRGATRDDLRNGVAQVIAASPVSNSAFLIGRWLGGVVYMLTLLTASMLVIMILHAIRGEGPIQPGVYLSTYAFMLIPMVFYAVSMAILFDSVPFLMGKLGDVAYFILWVMQVSLMAKLGSDIHATMSSYFVLDFNGLSSVIVCMQPFLESDHFAIGGGDFDAAVPPVFLPDYLWPASLIGMRLVSALIALLPLILAFVFFHRFSFDRIKPSKMLERRKLIDLLHAWARPLSRQLHAVYGWSARQGNFFSQVVAELCLSLNSAPLMILILPALLLLQAAIPLESLNQVLLGAMALWGVVMSDMSVRHRQAGIQSLVWSLRFGAQGAVLRSFAASVMLGVLMSAVVMLRMAWSTPILALNLLSGLLFLSAIASLLGTATGTGRSFLVAYLVYLYIATQAPNIPALDILGFNGVASGKWSVTYALLGGAGLIATLMLQAWRPRH